MTTLARSLVLFAGAALAAAPAGARPAADPVRVVTTTTDLRELVRHVGGDAVDVVALVRGPEDPHFLTARPSHARAAHDADLFVLTGMDLEIGWVGPVIRDARNGAIQPGRDGYCDASDGIDRLGVPAADADRSQGDVHPRGNPHYLLDPVRAKVAARTIADHLGRVDPDRKDVFARGLERFEERVDRALFGPKLLEDASPRILGVLLARGKLGDWLDANDRRADLGGWAARLLEHAGGRVVAYHSTFDYLADRFALEVVDTLEPKPGVPPSARHLEKVVRRMKRDRIVPVLYCPFQAERTAQSVAERVGGVAVRLAHQPGAEPGTEDWFAMMDTNVERLARSLDRTPGPERR